MTSAIDPSVIGAGDVDKASVRLQLERARDEISALQNETSALEDATVWWGGTAGGTANAVTLNVTPSLTTYPVGKIIRFIPSTNNTGATTVNVNGVGATSLRSPTNAACIGGELVTGYLTSMVYDGTSWRLLTLPEVGIAISSVSGGNLTAPAGTGTVWNCIYIGYSASAFTLTSPFLAKDVVGAGLVEAGVIGTIWSGIAFRKS